MNRIAKRIGLVPRALVREVIGNRSSMKRRRFGSGMARFCALGVRKQDAYLTEMQKLEFYEEDKIATKEDRGIQFRSPTYNAALALQLHNFEKRFYACMRNSDGTPMIAKGRSPIERGLILAAMASTMSNPKFVDADHSRFDAHCNEHLIRAEHRVYLKCRRWSKKLKWLLKQQMKTLGFSHGGIFYKIFAKRCSGDINTGCGNSLLNLGMLLAFIEYCSKLLGRSIEFRIFLDGDDSKLMLEASDLEALESLTGLPFADLMSRFMLLLGMVTEVIISDNLEDGEFCQSRVIWGKHGPVSVRNPLKVLDVLTKSPRVLTPVQRRQVLAASALGELMQAPGVPVIATASAALLTMSGGKPGFTTPDAYERFRVYQTKRVHVDVDDTMRVGFEAAWGITVAEQLALESYYTSMADLTREVPDIKPPKSRCGVDDFDVWDDLSISEFENQPEDDWWCDLWPLGGLVNREGRKCDVIV
nr:MAG: RNA-dependent RNA polymerase [Riboviria sp.]